MELGLEQQMFAPYSDTIIIIMNIAVLTCNCATIRGYIGDNRKGCPYLYRMLLLHHGNGI